MCELDYLKQQRRQLKTQTSFCIYYEIIESTTIAGASGTESELNLFLPACAPGALIRPQGSHSKMGTNLISLSFPFS